MIWYMNSPVDGRDRKRKGRTQQQQQWGGLRCICVLSPMVCSFFIFIFILLMNIYKVGYDDDDASTPPPPPPPPLNATSLRLPPSLPHSTTTHQNHHKKWLTSVQETISGSMQRRNSNWWLHQDAYHILWRIDWTWANPGWCWVCYQLTHFTTRILE